MIFTGTYEHAIDTKNRLAIPAELRGPIQRDAGAGEGEPVHLYVIPEQDEALSLYTEKGFERRADELDDSELDAEELLEYERMLFSLARRVELDKQGRVRLPDSLLQRVGLGSEVVLLGVKDHLEIRDRAAWSAYMERRLKERPGLLMNPRKAMRRGRKETN